MKVFVPFSESLVEAMGLGLGHLVPFQLEYQCLRLGETHEQYHHTRETGRQPIPKPELRVR